MGFFDQGGGFFPITAATQQSPQDPPPVGLMPDSYGVPEQPPQVDAKAPSIMERIWGSLGMTPKDALGSGEPKPELPGNIPLPPPRPPVPPDNLAADKTQHTASPGPSSWGKMGNTPFPIFGQPAQPAVPPGGGEDLSARAQAPAPAPAQRPGFLERLLGGKSNQDNLAQIMAGIGRGAAGIQGSGPFASMARGMGQGIEGSQGRYDIQQKQHDTAARTKLAIDQFEAHKPVWMSQAEYYQARARQQEQLAKGIGGKMAWQSTPHGLAHLAETEVQNWYKSQLTALTQQARMMDPEEYKKQKETLDAERDKRIKDAYARYKIDPDANGRDAQHPMDVSKMTPIERFNMPHGTFYKDPATGKVKVRDYNRNPPPGYTPGIGWNTGE